MKVTLGIAVSVAMFVLTAAALAEPSHTLDEAIHEVLLPGTTIVVGDNPKDNDFYVATEEDAVKIAENQKQAKVKVEAAVGSRVFKVLADKHEQTHKNIQIDPKLLATLNVDTKHVLNKYAAYQSKATIANINEKISTQKFEPVMVASADEEQAPQIENQTVTDYPLEPVFSATPKKPVKKAVVADANKMIVADASNESDAHPLEPLLTAIPKETVQTTKQPKLAVASKHPAKKTKLAVESKHQAKKTTMAVAKKAKPIVADKSKHSIKKQTIATAKKSIVASVSAHGAKRSSHASLAVAKSRSRQVHANLKSSAHKQTSRKAIAAHTPKGNKRLVAGIVKPYVPGKTVQRKHMLAVHQQSHRSHPVSNKYVVKTVSFDRHHRLKLVSLPKRQKAQKLSSNAGIKNRSRNQFKVIQLYR